MSFSREDFNRLKRNVQLKSKHSKPNNEGLDGWSMRENKDGFWIPGEVPSSKNSRNIFQDKSGKIKNLPNDQSLRYYKATRTTYQIYCNSFRRQVKSTPVKVEMFFVRKTNGTWDHHNAIQIVADQMVKCAWVPDDDVKNLLIYPPLNEPYYAVDKNNPGVLIRIL